VKVFVGAVLFAIVLAGATAFTLNLFQKTAYEAFATSGVRLSDPGYNLIGKSWNGLNEGKNLAPPKG